MRSILGYCNIFEFLTAKTLKLYKAFRFPKPSSEFTTQCRFLNELSCRKFKMTDCAKYFRLLQYFWIFYSKNIEIVLGISEFQNRVPNLQIDVEFWMYYLLGNGKWQIVRSIWGYCNIFEFLTAKDSNCIGDFRDP